MINKDRNPCGIKCVGIGYYLVSNFLCKLASAPVYNLIGALASVYLGFTVCTVVLQLLYLGRGPKTHAHHVLTPCASWAMVAHGPQ